MVIVRSRMLGRTSSSATPEAGTISYTYPNGSGSCAGIATLACGRTDANSTSTTYSYDALNRLTGKSYGGSSIGTGTASIAYYYDQSSYDGLTISNGNGLRTGMRDGSGSTAWSFDGMGRIAAVRKTINSVTNQANYTYNADGSTNTVQDFGGTTFTDSYDVSGRPTSIVDGSGNSYAASAVYDAAGQLTSLNHQRTSGGGAYVRSIQYNNRLQPSVISATLNGSTIQSLTYGYGTSGTNNGNILSIANGMNSARSQTYTYDYMNRVASGRDASHWGETYTIDNWGNLIQTQPMSGLSGNNFTVTANGNNQLSNLTYDSAGEVTKDQYSNTFTYDAEGRILSGGSGTYVYDGDGNRVKKTVSGTATLYWPGAGGLLDESNSSGSTMGKQVQFAGLLVWHEDTSGTGNFLFHDQLGSTRVTGSASGSLADDNDYYSFGTLFHNYGSSPSDNHYLFTGYESDAETSSDYAMFRNLGTMGRFNRPDPYDGSYDQTNPQSLNRYSYVLNNPLALTDPSGLTSICIEDEGWEDSPVSCGGGVGGGGGATGGWFWVPDWRQVYIVQTGELPGLDGGLAPIVGWEWEDLGHWVYQLSFGDSTLGGAYGDLLGGGAPGKNCQAGPLNLSQNIQVAKSLAGQFWSGLLNAGSPGGAASAGGAAGAYVGLVQTGGPWDPKTTMGMTPENVAAGNINFGATCSQFGGNTWLGGQVCQYGAGIYGKLSGVYGSSIFSSSHGDIPSDNQQIRQGLAIAKKGGC